MNNPKIIISGLLGIIFLFPLAVLADKCLYVSSYHQGYAWSDGVERGLRNTLKDKCELKQFDMDTKRHKDEASKKAAAQKAKQIIESWQPDVVITSDDNAARYLIKPFYKDHKIPFVFCGVNWSVDEYGLPYSNVTGIVEIAPIDAAFERITTIQGTPKTDFYIGADTLTEKKNLARFQKTATKKQVELKHGLANNLAEWINHYEDAQQYDFVIVGSNSGINDWDEVKAKAAIDKTTKVMSVTNHEWMMPYTILGLTKIPEEHGEWAAQSALYILSGTSPSDIPIVSNRKWEIWLNPAILAKTQVTLPKSISHLRLETIGMSEGEVPDKI